MALHAMSTPSPEPWGGVTVSIERIDAQTASAMLAPHPNRTLSEARIKQYMDALERGDWDLNGETIKVAKDDTLIDGQHRLVVVVRTGVPLVTVVVRGLDRKAQDTVDTGRARTFADILRIRGERRATNVAAVTRLVYEYENTGIPVLGMTGPAPSHKVLDSVLERHPNLRRSLEDRGTTFVLSRSVVGALHYLFASSDPEGADDFFERLRDGAGLERRDPIHTLRGRLEREALSSTTPSALAMAAITVRAWNAYINGEKLAHLQWKGGGANPQPFPRIDGCTIRVARREA